MGSMKSFFERDPYNSPFKTRNFRAKHQNSQINGETQLSQHNIILARQTRKQS